MSIFSEINRIKTAKDAIKQSIINRGGTLNNDAKLSDFSAAISSLPNETQLYIDYKQKYPQYHVYFIDIDGTILSEYYADENSDIIFPEQPNRENENLRFLEWNTDQTKFTDVFDTYSRNIVISPLYDVITADKTTIQLGITKWGVNKNTKMNLYITKTAEEAYISINWGDGNEENIRLNEGLNTFLHVFRSKKVYEIAFNVTGAYYRLGKGDSSSRFIECDGEYTYNTNSYIKKVITDGNCNGVMPYAFNYEKTVDEIIISNCVGSSLLSDYAFNYAHCNKLYIGNNVELKDSYYIFYYSLVNTFKPSYKITNGNISLPYVKNVYVFDYKFKPKLLSTFFQYKLNCVAYSNNNYEGSKKYDLKMNLNNLPIPSIQTSTSNFVLEDNHKFSPYTNKYVSDSFSTVNYSSECSKYDIYECVNNIDSDLSNRNHLRSIINEVQASKMNNGCLRNTNIDKLSIYYDNNSYKIPDYCFSKCYNLKQVKINTDKTSVNIGSFAFEGCYNLREIISNKPLYPESNVFTASGIKFLPKVKTNYSSFNNCFNLNSIKAIGNIEQNAFFNDYFLENVIIYDNCNTINTNAFNYCYNLKYIHLTDSVKQLPTLSSNAFSTKSQNISQIFTIIVPDNLIEDTKTATNWAPLYEQGSVLSYSDAINIFPEIEKNNEN